MGVIFFHLPLWFIQERKKEGQDCFSNIPGQNGIFTQTVLIITVLVSFTKSKMVQSDPNDCVIFFHSILPVSDFLFKGACSNS